MISFIVPAHNEQACLPRTLQAIHEAARVVGGAYEIIVVDDASTDATAEIARQNDARVVGVNHRQIAATRNSGGRAANGDRLFFVDADTTINPRAVAAAARYMDNGAAGGGAPTWMDKNEVVPLYIQLVAVLQVGFAKLVGFTGGAFMFCTRDAFHVTGGFNERLFWGEEGGFAMALKRQGRFVVLWKPVLTSGRRFRKTSARQLVIGGGRMILSPVRMMTQRSSVQEIWYDSNREEDDRMPNSLADRASNVIALLVLIIMATGPLWNFIPRSLTPWGSTMGNVRLGIGVFLGHVGLLFWPVSLILFWHLLQPKHWVEWLKLAALAAVCGWQAWVCTRGVLWFWPWLFQWLTHFLNG